MRKRLVIGSGGAGKSTLARRMAAITGLPLICLDLHYWGPGWVPTPQPAWDTKIARLLSEDTWIMDGNYGRTLSTRLADCDTIVFLDVPRLLCLWRLFKRRFGGDGRPDRPPGCEERLTWGFVRWVWEYRARRRPEILRQFAALQSTKQVIVLKNGREVERFLTGLQEGTE
jgi:adenylate kinase family enzyme